MCSLECPYSCVCWRNPECEEEGHWCVQDLHLCLPSSLPSTNARDKMALGTGFCAWTRWGFHTAWAESCADPFTGQSPCLPQSHLPHPRMACSLNPLPCLWSL